MGFAPTTWKQINPLDQSEDDGDDDEPRRVEEFMSPVIGTAMRCAIWIRSRAYMIGSTGHDSDDRHHLWTKMVNF